MFITHLSSLYSILLLEHLYLLFKHLDLVGFGSHKLFVGHDWRPKLINFHVRVQVVLVHVVVHLPLLKLLFIQRHIINSLHALEVLGLYHVTVPVLAHN